MPTTPYPEKGGWATEQLNIEGKRSGTGLVCHRDRLVGALSRAQAPKVRIGDIELGRKGFLGYLRLLSGGMVKVTPSDGGASEAQATGKGLRVVCGSNTSYLADGAWVTTKMAMADTCEVRVSPNASVTPNLGGIELADGMSRRTMSIRGCLSNNPPGVKLSLPSAT